MNKSLGFVTLLSLSRVAAADPVDAQVSYDPGDGQSKGFVLATTDDQFALRFSAHIQPFLNITTTPDETTTNIELKRARLWLDGNLWGSQIYYRFQSDFGKGNVTLKDFLFDVAVGTHTWLRVGQFKKPFSRQQITAYHRTELTDRAITDKAFGAGRDIGITLHNGYEKSPPWEWTIGVFNGTGDASTLQGVVVTEDDLGNVTGVDVSGAKFTNVPREFKPAVIARVGHNHGKLRGYSEGDLEGGPLRWGVGLSVQAEGDLDRNNKSNQKAELDYILKVQGFSSTGGLYGQTAQDGDSVYDQGKSLLGFHVQAGFMIAKRWQLAARYAAIGDTAIGGTQPTDQQELSIGASFYGHRHDAKVQGAVRLFKTGDAKFTDFVLFELASVIGF